MSGGCYALFNFAHAMDYIPRVAWQHFKTMLLRHAYGPGPQSSTEYLSTIIVWQPGNNASTHGWVRQMVAA